MLKNITPPTHNLDKEGKPVDSFPSLGQIRLNEVSASVYDTEGIPTVVKQYTDADGLPIAEDGVILIVSKIVMDAFPERYDLRCPDTGPDSVVRDSVGDILGVCRLQAT